MKKEEQDKRNQGWEADINKAVESIMSAVDIDLNDIKKNIQDTMIDIGHVVKESTKQYKESSPRPTLTREQAYSQTKVVKKEVKNSVDKPKAERALAPVNKKLPGRTSNVLCSVFGGIGTAGSLVAMTIAALPFVPAVIAAPVITIAISFLLGSIALLYAGAHTRRRNKRYRTYLRCIKGRSFCSIKELASSVQKSQAFVVRDLKKMIEARVFLEGHLDDEKNHLILNHETYRQYLATNESLQQRMTEQKAELHNLEEKKDDAKTKEPQSEVDKVIAQGRDYILQMRKANNLIPSEEISIKLERLETITAKIFVFVEKNPNKLPEIRKFMDYYLPTTLKLIHAYQEFEEHDFAGETISKAKAEIEQTLDTITIAFENLFDSMFEEVAMDLSTDISVLETMLTQEGLKKNF